MKNRMLAMAMALGLLLPLLTGCGQIEGGSQTEEGPVFTESEVMADIQIEDEAVALAESAASAAPLLLKPVASGVYVKQNGKAVIDYSNTADGYVMARYTAASDKKIKAQVVGPGGTTYTYNLAAGAENWTTFPLSDESGEYRVTVYENITGTKYATVLSVTFTAELADPFAPFLRPNQYVNYETNAENAVAQAQNLCENLTDTLEKVQVIYRYVVTNLTYDREKAASVQSGYLPVLDTVLETKKGICFDYAALMAAMLRSQGIPCKLVVGFAGSAYHAWINVYTDESGWINSAIYFDGTSWKLMDPTFASTGRESASIMQYIGDGSHYTAKYIY